MNDEEIPFSGIRREHFEIASEMTEIVERVALSGRMLQGPEVSEFESKIAAVCHRKYAVAVGSGTDALYFALLGLGLGPGDEVLVPDVSFIATAAAVVRTGAQPIFVDVDKSCLIDLICAEAAITRRTRAVMVVQLFGAMADPNAIAAFAQAHGLIVVEDAAQAFGAAFCGQPAGSVGKVSAVSFDPMKVLSAPGSGGAILTDDETIAASGRRLRYHGRENGHHVQFGFNSQMSTLCAAVLLAKLRRHESWSARRRQIAAQLAEAICDLPAEQIVVDQRVTHAWHKFVIRVDSRDALAEHLRTRGVPTMIHYACPFHREEIFGRLSDDEFPCACAHADRSLSLPIHAHLMPLEVEHIARSIQSYFGC